MSIRSGTRRRALRHAAEALYGAVVRQARRREFYLRCGVPDTLDGRFDMLVLHAFLVVRRLRRESGEEAAGAGPLAQALFDLMFADMDQSLREMGAGDLGVGRRVKAMAQAFYGRSAAYDAGLAADDEALSAAILRNLYRTVPGAGREGEGAAMIAAYARQADAALAAQPVAMLARGEVAFGEPPGAPP